MVYLEPGACLLWALLLLTLPLPWLLSALLAGLIHELCHLSAVQLWGGSVNRFCVGFAGTRIDTDIPAEAGRLLAILAGPLGSLLLCLLFPWQPRLAVCGFVQGIYNLLPIPSLDGGRLLRFYLDRRTFGTADSGLRQARKKNSLQTKGIRSTIENPMKMR